MLNLFFGISFTDDIVDGALLITFGVLVFIILIWIYQNAWMRILFGFVMILFTLSAWFIWELFGYEERIDKKWEFDKYNIQLQHRLEIAGPGCYWFLVNREFLGGIMERRIETRQYQAGLPDPPKRFKFVISNDTLEINCCESNIIIFPDSMTYEERLKHFRQMKK